MPLTIQLHPSQRQTAFNLERWREVLGDRDLARLPHRIETDRHGHILMSPPPAPSHGVKQAKIATLFDRLLPEPIIRDVSGVSAAHRCLNASRQQRRGIFLDEAKENPLDETDSMSCWRGERGGSSFC